jgi:hypothetical protein
MERQEMSGKPFKVWCLMKDQFAHVKPVEEHLGGEAEFVYDGAWAPDAMIRSAPDIVLCVNDYAFDIARCLDAAREAGIPSLVFQDGILEWRCQYENPLFGSGGGAPQHQPVLADKIACIGAQSARQIAAWGNPGAVEVTGMPRMDALLSRIPPPVKKPGKRILVMTAKNPGFTEAQTAVTLRSLSDVREVLESMGDVETIWRVSKNVERTLGVENQFRELSALDLADVLEKSDAVITTLSTAILEAMLLKRPVAALDYHNVPRFVPTAWTVTAPGQIRQVVESLLAPTGTLLAFQEDCLHDCLSCERPASPRAAELIRRLVALGAAARAGGGPLRLPKNMTQSAAELAVTRPVSLSELYPDEPVYAETDVQSLQVRLVRLQKKNEQLEKKMEKRSVARKVFAIGRSAAATLKGRPAGRRQ